MYNGRALSGNAGSSQYLFFHVNYSIKVNITVQGHGMEMFHTL